MDFAADVFTTVLDKGLLDAICVSLKFINDLKLIWNQSANRSPQNCKKYIQEVYRVLKRSGIFICISHDNERHTRYIQEAGVEWESIKIVKIYRPTVERESNIIREEFVSKEVLDKIKDLNRVEVEREDEESPYTIVPYSEMTPFKPTMRTAPILSNRVSEPEDIPCHFVYICKKPYIPTPEPSEDEGEEEEEEPKNKYRY